MPLREQTASLWSSATSGTEMKMNRAEELKPSPKLFDAGSQNIRMFVRSRNVGNFADSPTIRIWWPSSTVANTACPSPLVSWPSAKNLGPGVDHGMDTEITLKNSVSTTRTKLQNMPQEFSVNFLWWCWRVGNGGERSVTVDYWNESLFQIQ